MMKTPQLNLRHLFAFAEVCRLESINAATTTVHLSQPAITQALAKLETQTQATLFLRTGKGMRPTAAGTALHRRVMRALDHLKRGVPRGIGTAHITTAQLRALNAIDTHPSFAAAARALGHAQPSVFRAARDLEANCAAPLFQRTRSALTLTRAASQLSNAARLMFSELDQGLQDISHLAGKGTITLRIGALPLPRSTILPRAIERATAGPHHLRITVIDSPYPDLLKALRQGDIDILLGALQNPPPGDDIVQEPLFDDRLGIFCGPGHALVAAPQTAGDRLADYPWVLPRPDAPTRVYFETELPDLAAKVQSNLIETSSMILVRGLLQSGNRLTIISRNQVATEVENGFMVELPVALNHTPRPIGLTHRTDWEPTAPQSAFLAALREDGRSWTT